MQKIIVVGLGRFGATAAVDLCRRGAEVLAVDRNLRLVEALSDRVTVAVGFDATDRANLEAYDVGAMDVAVIAIGTNFEASVMVTMHCKALGVKMVYAKALNAMQAAVLTKVGADHVLRPEEDMGLRLAESLVEEKAVEFIDLPPGWSLRRLVVPDHWDGRTLADLKLPEDPHLSIVQVVRKAGADGRREQVPLPFGQTVLRAGDEVDAIGRNATLDKYA